MTQHSVIEREVATPGHAIGSRVPRLDAAAKISGAAEFVGDMSVAGMVHGKVLRSNVGHAKIRNIDVSTAETMPGVVAVLSAADLVDIDPYFGHVLRDRPIVAIDEVRFAGEPIAAVAAETEAQAEAALLAIVVEYTDLPVVANLGAALAPDAALVHEGPTREGFAHGLGKLPERDGNVCYRYGFERGDIDGAAGLADIVIDREYEFPAVYQYSMETHTVIARYTGDEIDLWSTCQHPFLVRAEIAALFGLAVDRVRVVVPYLGGGFGSKSYTKMEPIAVALARKARRAVRIVNRVDESMVTTRRHNMKCRMQTFATQEGELLGRRVEFWLDTGAYADNGPRVTATAADAAPGPYRWPSLHVLGHCVYTNTGPAGSYRAFGATHLQWIGESQIDEIARAAEIDPLEFRRRNLLRPGEEVRPGGRPLDADLVGDVEKAAAAIGWGRERISNRGLGVSVGLLAAGAHPVSSASVRMDADGGVTVLVGSTEMGQGARTVMAQIAAEVLSIDPTDVTVPGTDTQFTPYDRSTGASRSTTVAGKAVELAAREVLDALFETALLLFAVGDRRELRADDGRIWLQDRSVVYPELIAKRFGFSGGELRGYGEVKPEVGSGSYAEGPVFWEVCVAGAEVELDRDTGVVRILQTSTIADVGRAINPQLIERQDEGGAMQGLGNALFEEMLYTDDGMLLNDTLLDYRIPTIEDLPEKTTCIIVENGDGPGPFGAKGCGEGAVAALPAAIVNALADAGVPMTELPLTPERVWRQIQETENQE
ncbi:MAG: xanthine dehydrogenase family protein molybdopterin-binding subunit [Acidimicrobiia bacterium]|nr:MAG: xanthine dehydrogenase family protein molybdopterin-binding subunit [Acidimicrobiia bacterium]